MQQAQFAARSQVEGRRFERDVDSVRVAAGARAAPDDAELAGVHRPAPAVVPTQRHARPRQGWIAAVTREARRFGFETGLEADVLAENPYAEREQTYSNSSAASGNRRSRCFR